jgi:hypothetical protein
MIGLVRHDGEVTWMSEECYKSLTKVYKQYVAVIRLKFWKHGKN